jgi:uncharacterized coiled-coil DUF342 family protein
MKQFSRKEIEKVRHYLSCYDEWSTQNISNDANDAALIITQLLEEIDELRAKLPPQVDDGGR